MVMTFAPGIVLSAIALVFTLVPPAFAQAAGTEQQPANPQTPSQQPPPVVPGAEQPAGSPVLAAPPPTQRISDVNGLGSQVPTPYKLAPPARPGRPNRSIFGVPPRNILPLLTLDALFGGGRSGNLNLTGGPPSVTEPAAGYGALTGSANLTYSWAKPRLSFNADNVVNTDYYPQYSEKKWQSREIATFGMNFLPLKHTRVSVTQGYKNLPEFSFSELQDTDFGPAVPINQDISLTPERYWRYVAGADVSHRLTSRSTANFSMVFGHGVVTTGRNWNTLGLTGTFDYAIGKGLAAYLGYAYSQQKTHESNGLLSEDRHKTLRFGIDFARALSIARRTTLTFSSGLSEIQDRAEDSKQFYLIGSASLKREFGRSWETALVFSRNARFIEQVNQTLLTDSLSVIVQGTLTRRVQLKSSIGASAGQYGVRTSNGFDTYFGSVLLAVGLSRNLAFETDYSYGYLSNPNDAIPIAIPGQYSQSGVRAYLKFWTPVLSRKRSY